jgi:hypothetical protein
LKTTLVFHTKVWKQRWSPTLLSKVFIVHLCLDFFLLAWLLITINAALQIIKFSPELNIMARNYGCNKLQVWGKKFYSGHQAFDKNVYKQCSETLFVHNVKSILFILFTLICTHLNTAAFSAVPTMIGFVTSLTVKA